MTETGTTTTQNTDRQITLNRDASSDSFLSEGFDSLAFVIMKFKDTLEVSLRETDWGAPLDDAKIVWVGFYGVTAEASGGPDSRRNNDDLRGLWKAPDCPSALGIEDKAYNRIRVMRGAKGRTVTMTDEDESDDDDICFMVGVWSEEGIPRKDGTRQHHWTPDPEVQLKKDDGGNG